ncbi:MAG TPA: hypothetical protein VE953_11935 [Terriglobales bacterium]|nr:hypothetical protein [Terriglobales bacterium]
MTLRLILGLGWSLVAGLTGGWLVLAPWALGQQGGDWTTVTKSEFGAGLGLIVLALAGVVIVAVQTVRTLREAGALAPSRASRGAADGVTASPEMEKALIALAQALAEDLDAHREPAAPHSGGESAWRQPS